MLEVVLGGLTEFLAGLLGLLLGVAVSEVRLRAYKREAERKSQAVGTELSQRAQHNYGWSAKMCTSRLSILNERGDSRVIRGLHGIRPRREVPNILGKFLLRTPDGRIAAEPRFHDRSKFPKTVTCAHEVREVQAGTEIKYTVGIANSLMPQDPPLAFDVEVDCAGAVLMSLAEVKRAYARNAFKWDYHSVEVVYPVEQLAIVVEFPKGVGFKAYPDVFFGHETHHELELQRVRDGFTGGRESTFTIPNPKVGFEYLIYWVLTD